MKILKIEKGEYEEITTDDIEHLNKYRRIDQMEWQHWLGSSCQWLEIRFCDQLEDMYSEYMEEHGERNPNITNA